MALALTDKTLVEAISSKEGSLNLAKQAVLVIAGIAALAISAKIAIPMWPVPITMGTFAVLTLGAAYGPRLGLATIIGYMLIGMAGFDVFAGSSAEKFGLSYMMGGTGGYLVGYVLATLALGFAARAGWDRSFGKMTLAMLAGNALIYIPGLVWLAYLFPAESTSTILAWGITPFLIGDALKLALAAMVLPALWKGVQKFRG